MGWGEEEKEQEEEDGAGRGGGGGGRLVEPAGRRVVVRVWRCLSALD